MDLSLRRELSWGELRDAVAVCPIPTVSATILSSNLETGEIFSDAIAKNTECIIHVIAGTNEVVTLYDRCVDVEPINLFIQVCSRCQQYISLWCSGQWRVPEWFLSKSLISTAHSLPDSHCSIEEVKCPADFLTLYILSQFSHNQQDFDPNAGESPFCPPSFSSSFSTGADLMKIAWSNGCAVGFYTIKRKGTPFPQYPHVRYDLNTVDTIYVRHDYRRTGIATKLIDDILSMLPAMTLIGFSEPISDSLLKVLDRYTSSHPQSRDHLWSCSYNGEPGYRSNIYLGLRAQRRKQKATTN